METENKGRRGRPTKPYFEPELYVKAIIRFLVLFMPETLAKRIVIIVFVIAGVSNERIIDLVGVSEKSIWNLKNAMREEDIDSLFIIERGAGRPSKARGIEDEIAEEISKNNYHTRQQIADMIKEKFDISMSVSAVGKLLKKTAFEG